MVRLQRAEAKQTREINDMDPFLREYSSSESVGRYVRKSAGTGVDYLLENVYGPIFRDSINRLSQQGLSENGLRILEYGCGGAMNLLHIVRMIEHMQIPLEVAYGTDFSNEMIRAANGEADRYLTPLNRSRVQFFTASNEKLIDGLADGLSSPRSVLMNSFHFMISVNTFRYCHRLRKAEACAKDIFDLLVGGGMSIMIDMNQSFPFFRSRLRDARTKPKEHYYLPSLEEYSEAFERVGFRIIERRNFCWIPHSAEGFLFAACRVMMPILDTLFPHHAMRSLVIAVKPN